MIRRPNPLPCFPFLRASVISLLTLSTFAFAYDGPTGMTALSDFENLPRFYDGVNVYQSSSHDRGGGNYDSGNFVAVRGKEYVMLDAKGPGQITRLWLTNAGPNHRVRFYIDGESSPRIDSTVTELFSGAIYPFVWPLVGNDSISSGGYYCCVPVPFRTGCRIATDCKDLYYNVQYQKFDSADGVAAYDPCADPRSAIACWRKLREGEAPAEPPRRFEKTLSIPANRTADIIDFRGSGRVVAIRIVVKDLGEGERALSIIRGVRIKMYWDGSTKPAVDAPIGPFHCVWFPESPAGGLFVGSAKPGEFYCFFPMPFARRARIALSNLTGSDISGIDASVDIRESAEDARDLAAGTECRFSALCRKQTMKEGEPDYLFANIKGRGIALGVSALMIGAPGAGQIFLEGDERIYYDGARKPQLHGTGTEDFFNGGYYFDRGLFSLPLHGYTARKYEMRDQEAMYRLFLADRIFYRTGLVAGIEHGATNDQNVDYASVFYYYEMGRGKSKVESRESKLESRKSKVAVAPAPVAISGRVTLASGEPVAGAVVSSGKQSALTCPDGAFQITGLAPGRYTVRVESPRIVPQAVDGVEVAGGKATSLDLQVKSDCVDLLANGRFEGGFESGVARGWTRFNTELYQGEFSMGEGPVQRTHVPQPVEGDSYSGMWQRVRVVPGQLYTFSAECRTLYTGTEENPWDNVMGKLCVHPLGKLDFRSKDIDFALFPAEHNTWHRLSQKVAAVGDSVILYLAAWRKFPQGGDQADVEFRNVSFVGPSPRSGGSP